MKNRNREKPTFANINLLGKCICDCYFCLGKDIPELLNKHDQTRLHFDHWKNFNTFLKICKQNNIKNIYLTGQNTDPILYKYLKEIILYLKREGFRVGIRTSGYGFLYHLEALNELDAGIGLSIHSLNRYMNTQAIGRNDLPPWEQIISWLDKNKKRWRVASVINQYNGFIDLLEISKLLKGRNLAYWQIRRVSSDKKDREYEQRKYNQLRTYFKNNFPYLGDFYLSEGYLFKGIPTYFWATVETSANSFNYFTDGTISKEYFVVEGYEKNYLKKELVE